MSYTAHDPNAFFAAVKTRLEGQTSKNVGRGEAPSDVTLPYAVIYPLGDADEADLNGTLGDAHATTVFEWQVTSVGGTAEQAEWMQQKVRSALLGWSPTGDFGLVEKSGGQGTRRDDGTQPAQFYAVDTFTVFAS